jgi:DNA helicase-2/ATP-dependent DNA helicase PcrA
VVDFGELMLRSYELLRDNDPIREHYQRRFRHILIDEFQDTNKLQYAWIKLIAGQGEAAADHAPSAVLAVGDDDQSIYAFRGARVGNMADFVREFDVQHQIKLEQNYRSFSNILDSANELIATTRNAWARTCAPTRVPASRCGCTRRPATLPRRNGWSRKCASSSKAMACSARKSPCSTAATPRAG